MKRTTFALLALTVSTLSACATNNPAPATAATSPAAPTPAPVNTVELKKQLIDLEKRAWELSPNNQAEEFRKATTPGYRAIYFGGIKNLEEAIKDFAVVPIKQYMLSDFQVTFPVKDTAVLTYKTTDVVVHKGKELKESLNCAAVWVNIGGEWKSALYSESPARREGSSFRYLLIQPIPTSFTRVRKPTAFSKAWTAAQPGIRVAWSIGGCMRWFTRPAALRRFLRDARVTAARFTRAPTPVRHGCKPAWRSYRMCRVC